MLLKGERGEEKEGGGDGARRKRGRARGSCVLNAKQHGIRMVLC